MSPASLLPERSGALRTAREALREQRSWVVGGTVRNVLMERRVDDVDLAVAGDAEVAARRLATAANGHVFPLSERFGAWRVIARDHGWQADLAPVRAGGIEADLALRDFTINAMAVPLAEGEPVLDPFGGRRDIEAGTIRVLGERAYRDDPLRTLRMARFACELGFGVEPETKRLAGAHAGAISRSAPERVFYELRRLIVSERPLLGIELVDETGVLATILPELGRLKGVEQNPYHHLDVWGHTRAVLETLIEIERDPEGIFGELTAEVVAELERPLSDELSRAQALRFGALLHDIAKPPTRRVTEEGRVLFYGHDTLGAEMIEGLCARLRTSTDLASFLAALTRHHLRLGFLVHERPLGRRHVYRYMRACEPVELEVTVLSIADRLATRGERTSKEILTAHLELARELTREAIAWRSRPPSEPFVRGDELMRELGLEPGPRVGQLLELVREATFAGEVRSREEALELARKNMER